MTRHLMLGGTIIARTCRADVGGCQPVTILRKHMYCMKKSMCIHLNYRYRVDYAFSMWDIMSCLFIMFIIMDHHILGESMRDTHRSR